MRQGSNSRRSRGRGAGRRQNNVPLRHQTFDSNGPDVRIRGNAFQVYEKYLALARDATASGDRVMAENYYQHAEHYFRIISAINENEAARQNRRPEGGGPVRDGNGLDDDGETDGDEAEDERSAVNA